MNNPNDDNPLARGAAERKAALIAAYEQRYRNPVPRGPSRVRQFPTPDTLVPLHPPLPLAEDLDPTDKWAVLDAACQAGFVTYRGTSSPVIQSLVDQGFLVKGIGFAYVITRLGRLEATDVDTPVSPKRTRGGYER